MKILFTGDLHLSDRQIKTRIDNSREVSLEKLKWVLDFAVSQQCKAVVFPGDNFSTPVLSKMYLFDLKNLLRSYHDKLNILIITGNHTGDISDANYHTFKHKDSGQLVLDGYWNLLEDFVIGDNKVLRGYSAYQTLDESNPETVVGLVCHHFVGDAFNDKLVVYPDKLKEKFPNLEFLVAGHDHGEYPISTSVKGVQVVRPGSLMRVSSATQNRRIPKVALLGIEGGQFSFQYYPVTVAKPFEQCFAEEVKEIETDFKNSLQSFMRSVQAEVSVKSGIHEIIESKLSTVKEPALKELIRTDLNNNGFMEVVCQ